MLITVHQQHALFDVRRAGVGVIAAQGQRAITLFYQATAIAADNTADLIRTLQRPFQQRVAAEFDVPGPGKRADRRLVVGSGDIHRSAFLIIDCRTAPLSLIAKAYPAFIDDLRVARIRAVIHRHRCAAADVNLRIIALRVVVELHLAFIADIDNRIRGTAGVVEGQQAVVDGEVVRLRRAGIVDVQRCAVAEIDLTAARAQRRR
ncbi:hypothetical protein D3C86_1520090 [compost metagenome]